MPDTMTCFACEREPTRQCPRCGRPYCDEHGEDVCDACLNPGSGVPSFTLYRGSLLALLIGTAVAVWLIVQPSGGDTSANQALRPQLVTPTAVARAVGGATPGAPPAQTPGAPQPTPLAGAPGATPGSPPATTPGAPPAGTPRPPGATPGPGTTPAPAGTPGAAGGTPAPAAGTGSYTVVSGDTLSSICNQVKPASMSVSECVDRVVTLNRLSSSGEISIGQQLTVPR